MQRLKTMYSGEKNDKPILYVTLSLLMYACVYVCGHAFNIKIFKSKNSAKIHKQYVDLEDGICGRKVLSDSLFHSVMFNLAGGEIA